MPSIKELRKICQDRPDKHDFYMWAVARKVSIYLTWLFIRTPITPNQITSFSIMLGLLGSLFFISPNPWYWVVGWLIVNLHFILDQCDGEVAYYKNKVTKFGYFFDEIAHPVVNIFFFAMLAMGIYNITKVFKYAAIGTVLVFEVSIYRMVGLYEDYLDKVMFKAKAKKIDMPKSWIKRIGGIPSGLGGYFHIFLVATVLDIATENSILPSMLPTSMGYREVFLFIMAVGFCGFLMKRIYNLRNRLKEEKIEI